jgi:hypothetical protein
MPTSNSHDNSISAAFTLQKIENPLFGMKLFPLKLQGKKLIYCIPNRSRKRAQQEKVLHSLKLATKYTTALSRNMPTLQLMSDMSQTYL